MNYSEESLECLKLEIIEDFTEIFPTELLLNVLWIATLICCLGKSLSLHPLHNLQVWDRGGWESCARTSLLRLDSPEYVPMRCFCGFCPQEGWKATVLRWLQSPKQANRSEILSQSTHWRSDLVIHQLHHTWRNVKEWLSGKDNFTSVLGLIPSMKPIL
jgi:hypothetical protein